MTLSYAFKVTTKRTTLTRLTVKRIPRGAKLKATCKPKTGRKRCRIKTYTRSGVRGTRSLKRFIGKRLKPGVVIAIRVTKPGMIGAVKLLKIRSRKAPTTDTKCLRPGDKKPRHRC